MTEPSAQDRAQRRTLLVVLILNALLFVSLGVGGLLADSSALIANAADNASDSVVYLLSFLAVGRGLNWKRRAARACLAPPRGARPGVRHTLGSGRGASSPSRASTVRARVRTSRRWPPGCASADTRCC